MEEKLNLIIIEFTAFNKKGEKIFVTDIPNREQGIETKEFINKKLEQAKDELEEMCHSVVYHRAIQYELSVLDKKEIHMTEAFEIKPKHVMNNPR